MAEFEKIKKYIEISLELKDLREEYGRNHPKVLEYYKSLDQNLVQESFQEYENTLKQMMVNIEKITIHPTDEFYNHEIVLKSGSFRMKENQSEFEKSVFIDNNPIEICLINSGKEYLLLSKTIEEICNEKLPDLKLDILTKTSETYYIVEKDKLFYNGITKLILDNFKLLFKEYTLYMIMRNMSYDRNISLDGDAYATLEYYRKGYLPGIGFIEGRDIETIKILHDKNAIYFDCSKSDINLRNYLERYLLIPGEFIKVKYGE